MLDGNGLEWLEGQCVNYGHVACKDGSADANILRYSLSPHRSIGGDHLGDFASLGLK